MIQGRMRQHQISSTTNADTPCKVLLARGLNAVTLRLFVATFIMLSYYPCCCQGYLQDSAISWKPLKKGVAHQLFASSSSAEQNEQHAGNSGSDDISRGNQNPRWSRKLPFISSGRDTDVRPKRPTLESPLEEYYNYAVHDWGIEQQTNPIPTFPQTIESVAEAAFTAVAATSYGKAKLDPSLASNVMAKNVFDYRPVKSTQDRGRLGIEIDGAHFLMDDHNQYFHHVSNRGNALRLLVLVLARKLSRTPWHGFETDHDGTTSENANNHHPGVGTRPVAIYFNTVKQALVASQQLKFLKQQQLQLQQQQDRHSKQQHWNHQQYPTPFENVTIHCLGQNDELPLNMQMSNETMQEKMMNILAKAGKRRSDELAKVDPSRGVLIIVQPTDYNDEYSPPGPAPGVLASFQKLVAKATTQEIPVVMVSPRFFGKEEQFGTGTGRGWDQSMGSHQASTFGGLEPPTGPTPWILRDFSPPIYCWVGNAMMLDAETQPHYFESNHDGNNNSHSPTSDNRFAYSRIALTQSVMDEGHPWHVFAGKRDVEAARAKKVAFVYNYLASTKPSSGRPTQTIMRRILSEFASPS